MLLCLIASCRQTDTQSNLRAADKQIAVHKMQSTDTGYQLPKRLMLADYSAPRTSSIIEPVGKLGVYQFVNSYTKDAMPEEAQGKGLFTAYTTDDGLALDQVYCSYTDSKGHLWFGTNGGGVSRFDGRKFTNFTKLHGLASNVVWCILEDNKGHLWFGTDGNGVSEYDGVVFKNYTSKDGLSGDVVFSMKQDNKGNLWFGTSNGLTQYNGTAFKRYTVKEGLTNNAVKDIWQDKKGYLWLATLGGGVSRFDGNNFRAYRKSDGLTSDTIRSIHEDVHGRIWFGTNSSGVSIYDDGKFIDYSMRNGLAGDQVLSIIGDSKGNMWIGTNGGGVSKFDGQQFINYGINNGLESGKVPCIAEDARGNIWLGTFGGGVVKYSGSAFSNYTTKQGLPNNVIYGITEDVSGNVWLGSFGGGLSKYDRNSITTYNTPQGLPSNKIYCATRDSKGRLWFGSFEGGAFMFDGKRYTQYTTKNGLAGDIVFCIKEDAGGNLWFGTSNGLSKFDGSSFTNYTKAQGLPVNSVFCIEPDTSGSLWLGTYGGGVSHFDGNAFINLNTQHGLTDNTIWDIHVDAEKNIWVGTQQGLSILPKERANELQHLRAADTIFSQQLFQQFTMREGLPDNFVTQIIVAGNNRLYIGTNLGVCELVLQSNKDNKKQWQVGQVFNTATGYPIKDVNAGQGAMFQDSKGIIWIATGSEKTGLVRFDPKALYQGRSKPPVLVIQQLSVNNEQLVWNDLDDQVLSSSDPVHDKAVVIEEMISFGRQLTDEERVAQKKKFGAIRFSGIDAWYPVPKALILPYNQNSIGFVFNAIQTDKNELVQYQYKLEGYDQDWSAWTSNNTAVFGNMDAGTYTFQLRARNDQGIVSTPLTYQFTVNSPWWATWWMYTFYVLVFVTLIYLIVLWNNRRILAQKKKLEHKIKIATEQIRAEKENVETQKQIAEEALKQLKGTQAQLVQAEKMASLGELTAGIAHEIQNPLNFVNNFSEVGTELLEEMKEEMDKGNLTAAKEIAGEVQQSLEKIQYHGKRAGDIVKGMLQHSRNSSGQKEPVAINALCDEYFRLAYHGLKAKDKSFNVSFDAQFDANIGVIEAVPQEIGRVLLNLINNALYAVNHRKKTGEAGYEPRILIETKRIDQFVRITVTDNGAGIPESIKSKILQPFFTTKPTGEGTGLGLSLSYDIITVGHGGTLSFESAAGQGTSFVVQLPIQSASA